MTLILVYTLSKTILGHSFFNYILVDAVLVSYIQECCDCIERLVVLVGGI